MSDQLIQGGLKLNGRCLCEGASYAIDGPLTDVRNSHCSIRRKAHSAAFRSRAGIRPAMPIHVGSMAPWFEITDTLSRYKERPLR